MILRWHLIPDGSTTIMRLTLEIEQTLSSESVEKQVEEVVAHIVHLLTGRPSSDVIEKIQEDRWLGEGPRPDEPEIRL